MKSLNKKIGWSLLFSVVAGSIVGVCLVENSKVHSVKANLNSDVVNKKLTFSVSLAEGDNEFVNSLHFLSTHYRTGRLIDGFIPEVTYGALYGRVIYLSPKTTFKITINDNSALDKVDETGLSLDSLDAKISVSGAKPWRSEEFSIGDNLGNVTTDKLWQNFIDRGYKLTKGEEYNLPTGDYSVKNDIVIGKLTINSSLWKKFKVSKTGNAYNLTTTNKEDTNDFTFVSDYGSDDIHARGSNGGEFYYNLETPNIIDNISKENFTSGKNLLVKKDPDLHENLPSAYTVKSKDFKPSANDDYKNTHSLSIGDLFQFNDTYSGTYLTVKTIEDVIITTSSERLTAKETNPKFVFTGVVDKIYSIANSKQRDITLNILNQKTNKIIHATFIVPEKLEWVGIKEKEKIEVSGYFSKSEGLITTFIKNFQNFNKISNDEIETIK